MRAAGISMIAGLALVAISYAQPVVAAQDPAPKRLTPDTQWVANWAEDRCRISRRFVDSEGEPTILYLEQIGPSSRFNMLVASDELDIASQGEKIGIAFGPFPTFERGFSSGRFGEFRDSALFSSIQARQAELGIDVVALQANDNRITSAGAASAASDAFAARAILDTDAGAQIETIALSGDNGSIVLQTGALGGVFDALNSCTADLLESWGITMEEYSAIDVSPAPKNMTEVARKIQRQYPKSALAQGRGALFRIRLIVGADGDVETCSMVSASDDRGFTDVACRIMLREAEFEPGKDADGRPVRSTFTTAIRYAIG